MNEILEGELVEGTSTELEATTTANLFQTRSPVEVLDRAAEVATALSAVIEKQQLFSMIQGKKHVRVEGWLTLAAMLGVTPVCVSTRKLDDGWEARVEARTLDGRTIGAAEAMCVRAEGRWEKAEDYAIRSMAQTRATSKALGSVLRFVVTLAGYSGTPAEEMDGVVSRGDSQAEPIPPSDAQMKYLMRLLADRNVPATARTVVESWARENLTGGKGGTCSETIDALKGDGDRADRTAHALVERAQQALAQESDVPADTEGLIDPPPQEEELPFT